MTQATSTAHPTNGYRTVQLSWAGPLESLVFEPAEIKSCLHQIDQPVYIVRTNGRVGATNKGTLATGAFDTMGPELLAWVGPLLPEQLGDPAFRQYHRTGYAYMTGAMANAIASEDLVIAMGQAGLLGSFGAGGCPPHRVEAAIQRIQAALPQGAYAFNLIHSPTEAALERGAVELFLRYGVHTIEASAFLALTPHVVRYRVAGLQLNSQNQIEICNRVIAKVSRREVAEQFLRPAPAAMVAELRAQGQISEQQANLAQYVPMADDITVEADSGGHTDNRPLVCLLPVIRALRDELQAQHAYALPVRIGAAGGIGTPDAVLAAYMMGAAYVVTGSVNQACIEAGTSLQVRQMLAEAEMTDVIMAPAADMFEMGVKLQVLRRSTLFAPRAQKLYDLYQTYNSLDEMSTAERARLEKQLFRKPLEAIWNETVDYFSRRDPEQIAQAENDPKRKMALVFRWYLGLSSRWANTGEDERAADYQIWCGPAMGAFNQWVRGSYLERLENRRVVDVSYHLMRGAAVGCRMQQLHQQGVQLPAYYSTYQPQPFAE